MDPDRFRGALLGLALGDALGAPYEFSRPPFTVEPLFGTGYFGTAPGHPTDDTTLALFCAEALLDGSTPFAAAYVDKLVKWVASGPPDVGGQTAAAARAWSRGGPPAADEEAQGNGSLMAVTPVALRHAGDAVAARREAAAFAGLTHPSPAAAECNEQLVTMIVAALAGEPVAPVPPFEGVAGMDPAGRGMGWCRLTLHLAGGALVVAEDDGPFRALAGVIGRGGDTDTNGAVAGALLGAVHGTSAWPGELVAGLAAGPHAVRLADALYELAAAA